MDWITHIEFNHAEGSDITSRNAMTKWWQVQGHDGKQGKQVSQKMAISQRKGFMKCKVNKMASRKLHVPYTSMETSKFSEKQQQHCHPELRTATVHA